MAIGLWPHGGIVVAPSSKLGTCRQNTASGVTSDVYDYFLVDSRLQDRILGVDIDEDYPSYPHKPVRLTLKAKVPVQYHRVQRLPKAFPKFTTKPADTVKAAGVLWPVLPEAISFQQEATGIGHRWQSPWSRRPSRSTKYLGVMPAGTRAEPTALAGS